MHKPRAAKMSHSTPMHQMNPLDRFSNRAGDYARYRPSYPADAIAVILADLGEPGQLTAADVGAGTGISARLLADQGVTVWAIEPNAAMRQSAEPHAGVTFQAGTAEQTGLPDSSVDLVTCFQAFHWFDPARSLDEFHRILRSTGRVALVWNERDQDDPFTTQYTQLIRVASNQHPAEHRNLLAVETKPLASSDRFQNFRHHSFVYRQAIDLPALIGRIRSTSYLPQEGVVYDQLVDDVTQLYRQWEQAQGAIDLLHRTDVFLAEPSSP